MVLKHNIIIASSSTCPCFGVTAFLLLLLSCRLQWTHTDQAKLHDRITSNSLVGTIKCNNWFADDIRRHVTLHMTNVIIVLCMMDGLGCILLNV